MASIESDSYERLCEWLKVFEFLKGELVIIDGESGAGKSSLAMRLAKDSGAIHINLDCYVRAGDNYYVDLLEHEYLQNDIRKFKALFPLIIIEGICVQDVLWKYGMAWSAAIYVKKISTSGLWHFFLNLEDFISGKPDFIPEPFLSDFSYHAKYKPHDKAGFIYAPYFRLINISLRSPRLRERHS